MLVRPKIVQKGWGEEVWIHNDKEYCGKSFGFSKQVINFHFIIILLKKKVGMLVKEVLNT